MSKATVKITTTRTRTPKSSSKASSGKGHAGQKRCPTCGKYR